MPGKARPLPTNLSFDPVVTDADLETVLDIRNRFDAQPISVTTLRARIADDVATQALIARSDGTPIAASWGSWNRWLEAIGEATFRIWVLPEWRGRGVGSRLFEDLREFSLAKGAVTADGRVQEGDAASLAFVRNRGLEIYGRVQFGLYDLDLARAAGPTDRPAGITLASVAERPDLRRAVYELESSTWREIPHLVDVAPPTWEAWSAHLAEDVYLPDLSLVALEGDAVVGSLSVDDDGEGDAFVIMLCVAPSMRRRGIGRALKMELARRAAAAGRRHLITQNDGSNAKVVGLNESLGYRYLPAMLLVRGPLART